MKKSEAPITKSEFGLFECGVNYWKKLELVSKNTSCTGTIRKAPNGAKYEVMNQLQNTVYIHQV